MSCELAAARGRRRRPLSRCRRTHVPRADDHVRLLLKLCMGAVCCSDADGTKGPDAATVAVDAKQEGTIVRVRVCGAGFAAANGEYHVLPTERQSLASDSTSPENSEEADTIASESIVRALVKPGTAAASGDHDVPPHGEQDMVIYLKQSEKVS